MGTTPELRIFRRDFLGLILWPALLILNVGVRAWAATPGIVNISSYLSPIDNTDQPFSVYVPVGFDPGAKHPCVIYLHGFGGRLSTTVTTAQKAWADSKQWLIATADGRGSVNYDHAGERDVLQVRNALITQFGADALRIYLQGFSMGGHGTYRLAVRFPDLFAAANPLSGWTDFMQFYPQYYEQASSPKLPDYLDPTRSPLLQHTAALPQAENGLAVAWRIYYRTGDTVNPPSNALQMIDAFNALGHTQVQVISQPGGHGAEALENAYPFFEGKAVNPNPESVAYTTSRLRHDGAFWIQVDAFTDREQPGRIQAQIMPIEGRLAVSASNVERFTLSPSSALIAPGTQIQVSVNGQEAFLGAWTSPLAVRKNRDADGFANGWTTAVPPAPSAETFIKSNTQEGPMDEATLGGFTVVYGTSGSTQQTADNLKDAQLFCGQWNARMILRWTSGTVNDGWWVPPYTFAAGSFINSAQAIMPVSDAAAAGMDLSAQNLILFGDPGSNTLIDDLRTSAALPLELDPGGGSVTVGGRTYSGPSIRWAFVHPRPDAPGKLALVSKGFLSSLPELNWSPFDLGKDSEQWPWLLPDYVIWDTDRASSGIFNEGSQYTYFPERYLEAGFFTATWRVDSVAPKVRASFTGPVDPNASDTFLGPGNFLIEATDGAGNSGIDSIEYRINDGPWQSYVGPVPYDQKGSVSFEYRASDRGLSYLYGPDPSTGKIRSTQTLNNTSPIGRMEITVTGSEIGMQQIRVKRFRGRLQRPEGRKQPGDRIRVIMQVGEGIFTGDLEGTTLALTLGTLNLGPFTLDTRGKFEGASGADRARGRVRLRKGKGQVRLLLRNVDLESALGIPADALSGPRSAALTLSVNSSPAASTTLVFDLTRAAPQRPGRLRD